VQTFTPSKFVDIQNKSAVWVNNWHTQEVPVIKEVAKLAHIMQIYFCVYNQNCFKTTIR
jgi:hypothetical protein